MSWLPWSADRADHRWIVAVHEAGHLIAARRLRARGAHATVADTATGGARGQTTVRAWRGSDLDQAIYVFAGSAAAKLITGREGLHGSDDLDVVHNLCAAVGAEVDDVRRRAERLARRNRGAIERAADVLYRDGRV